MECFLPCHVRLSVLVMTSLNWMTEDSSSGVARSALVENGNANGTSLTLCPILRSTKNRMCLAVVHAYLECIYSISFFFLSNIFPGLLHKTQL